MLTGCETSSPWAACWSRHRRDRKLDWKPARLPDPVLHKLRQLAKVRIAGVSSLHVLQIPITAARRTHPQETLVPHPAAVNDPSLSLVPNQACDLSLRFSWLPLYNRQAMPKRTLRAHPFTLLVEKSGKP